MIFAKQQLRLIQAGRALLQLWENSILKPPYYFVRAMTQFVLENSRSNPGADLVGAEIGVYLGLNADSVLHALPVKKLYLIDPYRPYEGLAENEPGGNKTQADFDRFFETARNRLAKFQDKIEYIRKKSEDAVNDVPDNLDFVYIDGNHKYEYVKKDIELYYPKVKRGGVLGGDNFESAYPGVARAVLEFTDKLGLEIHGRRSLITHDWWVIKK